MHNIFDNLPLDQMVILHHPENDAFEDTFETLEFYILKHIYLSHLDLPHLYSPRLFRRYMCEYVKCKSPQEIAEIALVMCDSYCYAFYQTRIKEGTNAINTFANIIPKKTALEFRSRFNQENLIRDELIDLLLLAYFYIDTHTIQSNWIPKNQLQEIMYNIEFREGPGEVPEIYRYINGFQKNSPPFMYNFLLSEEDVKLAGHKGKSPEIFFRSPLDIGIMSCIISSASNSKNPFALHTTCKKESNENGGSSESNPRLNLQLFLNNCDVLMMTPYEETAIVSKLLKGGCRFYEKEVFFIYDQYLLERLSCINFLYKLNELRRIRHFPAPTRSILSKFMVLPLVNYRFSLLDFHERVIMNHIDEWDTMILSEWNALLQKDLKYLTYCLIPVLDMVFHYLMTLRYCFDENGEKIAESIHDRILKDMMPCFSSVIEKQDITYFTKKNDSIVPTRVDTIPNKRLDKKMAAFIEDSYLSFYQQIGLLRDNHLYSDSIMQKFQLLSSNLMQDVLFHNEERINSDLYSVFSEDNVKVIELSEE